MSSWEEIGVSYDGDMPTLLLLLGYVVNVEKLPLNSLEIQRQKGLWLELPVGMTRPRRIDLHDGISSVE